MKIITNYLGFLGTNQTRGHLTFSIIIKLLIKLNIGMVTFPNIFVLISCECNVIYIYIYTFFLGK